SHIHFPVVLRNNRPERPVDTWKPACRVPPTSLRLFRFLQDHTSDRYRIQTRIQRSFPVIPLPIHFHATLSTRTFRVIRSAYRRSRSVLSGRYIHRASLHSSFPIPPSGLPGVSLRPLPHRSSRGSPPTH